MTRAVATPTPSIDLPSAYCEHLSTAITTIQAQLPDAPRVDLESLEARPGWRHFPSLVLVAALLYARHHAANRRAGDASLRALAAEIGDLFVRESASGRFRERLDHHRDTYMWLEAYRLLDAELGAECRTAWRREIEANVALLYDRSPSASTSRATCRRISAPRPTMGARDRDRHFR